MEIALTKLSSKGQIVIPVEMRTDLKQGDKLLVIKGENQLIIKKASKLEEKLAEDLEFAMRTEQRLKEYEAGKFTTMDFKEFIKELDKW
ncbi:MAG: AbrB/MazE/SpoVT family DNA-binding domain-containing protein [Candidatus Woesearchaeota archaeon]